MNIGDRVKYSDSALRHDRDYYLGMGHPTRKAQAREHYETKRALRGTITGVKDKAPTGVIKLSSDPFGYSVAWDNGTTMDCMAYVIDKA